MSGYFGAKIIDSAVNQFEEAMSEYGDMWLLDLIFRSSSTTMYFAIAQMIGLVIAIVWETLRDYAVLVALIHTVGAFVVRVHAQACVNGTRERIRMFQSDPPESMSIKELRTVVRIHKFVMSRFVGFPMGLNLLLWVSHITVVMMYIRIPAEHILFWVVAIVAMTVAIVDYVAAKTARQWLRKRKIQGE